GKILRRAESYRSSGRHRSRTTYEFPEQPLPFSHRQSCNQQALVEILVEVTSLPLPDSRGENAHDAASRPPKQTERIVLDTNVCLDLFVFRDFRCMHLLEAMRAKRIEAVTRADCRTEWSIVLRYPHLPIDEAMRREAEREFDALIACIDDRSTLAIQSAKLPVCKDRDDQKFLETARDTGASALITKDKALLKLARKTVRVGLFRILLP